MKSKIILPDGGGVTVADFEKPELFVAGLFVGIIISIAVEQLLTRTSNQARREKTGPAGRKGSTLVGAMR
ncbi:hypothetical protein NXC14_PA00039 (plasmid) [Rhizobium sp. NXC14]|nr:hypothetical protein NXC14_PA00039 [Rhizobium sp. NXC14]